MLGDEIRMMLLYDVTISIDGAEVMAVLHPRNHVIADCVYQQRRDLATWRLGEDWRSVFVAVCSTMCSGWNWDRSICMCIYLLYEHVHHTEYVGTMLLMSAYVYAVCCCSFLTPSELYVIRISWR